MNLFSPQVTPKPLICDPEKGMGSIVNTILETGTKEDMMTGSCVCTSVPGFCYLFRMLLVKTTYLRTNRPNWDQWLVIILFDIIFGLGVTFRAEVYVLFLG